MKFYVLECEGGLFGTKWAYFEQVDPVHIADEQWDRCPVCGEGVGMLKWLPPYRVELSSAKPEKWGDFVWGPSVLLMVSEWFKAIYEQEGLSGIEFFEPVEVVRVGTRKTGDLPPDLPRYYMVKVIWDGANQDDVASKVVFRETPKCAYCRSGAGGRLRQEGIILEEGSWKGADLFQARGSPGVILVSERFKEVAERYRLKNAWLIPAEKFAWEEGRPGLWYILD
jgi:hypothetical protein